MAPRSDRVDTSTRLFVPAQERRPPAPQRFSDGRLGQVGESTEWHTEGPWRTSTYPQELRYYKEHDWVRVDGEDAVVGITWFAQDAGTG